MNNHPAPVEMITPEMDPRADDAGLELLGETAIETAVETLISPIVPVMEPLEGSLMDGMFPLLAPIMTLSQTMELFWHRVDALTDARGVTREVPLNPAEVTRRQSLVDAHAARAYSMQQAVAEQHTLACFRSSALTGFQKTQNQERRPEKQ